MYEEILNTNHILLPVVLDVNRLVQEYESIASDLMSFAGAEFKSNTYLGRALVNHTGDSYEHGYPMAGETEDETNYLATKHFIEEQSGNPIPTDIASAVPYTMSLIEKFGAVKARYSVLTAGSRIGKHSDFIFRSGELPYVFQRIHIPIITHSQVRMCVFDEYGMDSMTYQTGAAVCLNTFKTHAVINKSPIDRVHLILNVMTSEPKWQNILRRTTHEQSTQ